MIDLRGESGARKRLIIAEVAQSHDGSLGQAHAFIDAAAGAGADAIKFQTHMAAEESTPAEPWRVRFSYQDESRYDYWRRMEFTEQQWVGLASHCRDVGIEFMSSAFSPRAVELLEKLDVGAWKVASGEVSNLELLQRMLETKRPVILSSGFSFMAELDAAVDMVRAADVQLAVLQCTTAYPCPPESIGLNVLQLFRDRYGCPVGLSDHSGTIYPGLAAVALGAEVIEVHLALSKYMFGPDVPASVTVKELRMLVEGARMIGTIVDNPVDKDTVALESEPMRALFSKSVVAREVIIEGTVITRDMLAFKKPGTGIPAGKVDGVIGRVAGRTFDADDLIDEGGLR